MSAAEVSFLTGVQRFEDKDLVGAIECWREAARIDPSKSEYHRRLGLALTKNPRWRKEAEKHLLEATRVETRNAELFIALGNIYLESGLKKRAESQFRNVLLFDSRNREARKILAEMGITDLPEPKGRKSAEPEPEQGGVARFFSKLFKKK